MPRFYAPASLLLTLLTAPLFPAAAQQAARLAPAPSFAPRVSRAELEAGAQACRKGHMQAAAALLAHRPTTDSRRHERLMNRYDVTFAQLDLRLERTSKEIGVGSNVLTRARNVSATTALDTIGFELFPSLTLDSLTLDGRRVPAARVQRLPTGDVRVRPVTPIAPGATFALRAWYRGIPTATGSAAIGDGISSDNSGRWGNRVTWTLSEPFSAYEWWPCKQVLVDKLDSVAVWITTSSDAKAGSNGVLERTVPLPGNKVRYEWKSRYPIAYYLVSVTIAEYVDYTTYARPANLPAGSGPIPIVNYIYNNPQTLPTFRADIDDTAPMLENFSTKFGLYPFWREKYGHCMAPFGGGMEHQTMTSQGSFSFGLTSHELFHQWFGDNVTCRAWQDIWINEGFASYGEYISLQDLRSQADADQWIIEAQNVSFSQPDGSVVLPDADSTNVGRIFDYALSYKKGGAVIHMLRHVIDNDSAFFASLAAFQQQYGGRTARTVNLKQSLEASLNRPLGWFFDQWLYGAGYPSVSVRWNQVGNTLILNLSQTASAPALTPFFRLPLEIGLPSATGSSLPAARIEQTQAVQTFLIPLPVGFTLSAPALDPAHWNLLQITRVQRDNALVLATAPDAATATLRAFPNPCTDVLRFAPTATARTADVLDLTGRRVARVMVPAAQDFVPTATLARGTYLLQLTEASTGRVQQARFCKE